MFNTCTQYYFFLYTIKIVRFYKVQLGHQYLIVSVYILFGQTTLHWRRVLSLPPAEISLLLSVSQATRVTPLLWPLCE